MIYNIHKNHVMVTENGVQKKRSMKWWKKRQRREELKLAEQKVVKGVASLGASVKQVGDAFRKFGKIGINI